MEEDIVQAPADRDDANAVRSPEDERTLGEVGYDAFGGEFERQGEFAVAWKDSCWQKEFEAAATAVRDKVMTDILILERARVALQKQHDWHLSQTGEVDLGSSVIIADEYGDSTMFEETTAVLGQLEAEILRRISPPCVPDRRD